MKNRIALLLVCAFFFSAFSIAENKAVGASTQAPRVFLLDSNGLRALRQRIANGHFDDPALGKLRRTAEASLAQAPVSVTQKDAVPPSGDKRDYMSLSPYFWPDKSKPNGLPYVVHDGERNPEADTMHDEDHFNEMMKSVYNLSVAYYLFQDDRYAEHAAKLLRAWFLDPKTGMKANLKYGQLVRGMEGSGNNPGGGLIEVHKMPYIVDSVGLLAGSKAWTDADQKGMREWFSQYLDWLRESPEGRHEGGTKNNHGCYYDSQAISIALFLNKTDLATKMLENEKKRMSFQIEKDGKQPTELVRTRALHYSTFNLQAWFRLAALGQSDGINLWNYKAKDGGTIRAALDFLVPYATKEKPWPYKQINQYHQELLAPLLMMASVKYNEPQYAQVALKLDPEAEKYIEPLIAKFGQSR